MPFSKMSLIILILVLLGVALGTMWYREYAHTEDGGLSTPAPSTSDREAAQASTNNPNSDVVVRTDAVEYSTGAPVSISLQNSTDRALEIENPFYVVERYTNNAWVPMRFLRCGCGKECKEAAFHALTPRGTETYDWDRTERWCTRDAPDGEQTLPASQGTYRVKVNIAEANESHSGTAHTYYSNIFTISE